MRPTYKKPNDPTKAELEAMVAYLEGIAKHQAEALESLDVDTVLASKVTQLQKESIEKQIAYDNILYEIDQLQAAIDEEVTLLKDEYGIALDTENLSQGANDAKVAQANELKEVNEKAAEQVAQAISDKTEVLGTLTAELENLKLELDIAKRKVRAAEKTAEVELGAVRKQLANKLKYEQDNQEAQTLRDVVVLQKEFEQSVKDLETLNELKAVPTVYEHAVLAHTNPVIRKMKVELSEAKERSQTTLSSVKSKQDKILRSLEEDIRDVQTAIEDEKHEADKLRKAITEFKSAAQPVAAK